jgi:hypothetical protein
MWTERFWYVVGTPAMLSGNPGSTIGLEATLRELLQSLRQNGRVLQKHLTVFEMK